jgi:hypothetical protein
MENVGHALIVDDPERFNSLLKNFVSGLPFDWVLDYSPRR